MLNSTDKIIKHKTGLLNLAEELGNVSKACQVMGMSHLSSSLLETVKLYLNHHLVLKLQLVGLASALRLQKQLLW